MPKVQKRSHEDAAASFALSGVWIPQPISELAITVVHFTHLQSQLVVGTSIVQPLPQDIGIMTVWQLYSSTRPPLSSQRRRSLQSLMPQMSKPTSATTQAT